MIKHISVQRLTTTRSKVEPLLVTTSREKSRAIAEHLQTEVSFGKGLSVVVKVQTTPAQLVTVMIASVGICAQVSVRSVKRACVGNI